MKKSMFPKDIEDWSLDEKDTFRCYRQDIADTYVTPILNIFLLFLINTYTSNIKIFGVPPKLMLHVF